MSLLVKTSFKLLTTNANQLARLLLCQQQSPEALSRTTLRRTAWVSSFKRKPACCTYAFRCLGCVIWSKGLRNVRLLGRFSLLSMNWATEVGVTSASLASSVWASIWRFRRQPFFFSPTLWFQRLVCRCPFVKPIFLENFTVIHAFLCCCAFFTPPPSSSSCIWPPAASSRRVYFLYLCLCCDHDHHHQRFSPLLLVCSIVHMYCFFPIPVLTMMMCLL